jgi:hypothetical protein
MQLLAQINPPPLYDLGNLSIEIGYLEESIGDDTSLGDNRD